MSYFYFLDLAGTNLTLLLRRLLSSHHSANKSAADHISFICTADHNRIILKATMRFTIATIAVLAVNASAFTPSTFTGNALAGPKSTSALDMKYKVAVVGGGPSGACAAEIFAQEKNIDTVLFERKMDNAKPCGGAIPLCMVGEFDMPESVVDRKVRNVESVANFR